MNNTISIIIPAYNNLILLTNAVHSILRQSILPIEIIICDDSNNNDIEDWCNLQNSNFIKYYHNRPPLGAVKNWNFGIEKVLGDWIIILHHDEELSDNKFIESISKHMSYYDIIISNIIIRTSMGDRQGRINGILKKFLLKIPLSLLCINSIGPCACIAFKRSILQKFDMNLTWLVDTEWYYRLMKTAQNIKYIPTNYIISNHGHSDQITANIDIREKDYEDKKYLHKKYKNNLSVRTALKINSLLGTIRRCIRR